MKSKIGIAIIVIGIGHTALGLYSFHDQFSAMFLEGLLSSGVGEMRELAFWFTFSGILMIILGLSVGAIESHNASIPMSVGLFLLVTSVLGAAIYPVSGFWLLLAVSLAILFSRQVNET